MLWLLCNTLILTGHTVRASLQGVPPTDPAFQALVQQEVNKLLQVREERERKRERENGRERATKMHARRLVAFIVHRTILVSHFMKVVLYVSIRAFPLSHSFSRSLFPPFLATE